MLTDRLALSATVVSVAAAGSPSDVLVIGWRDCLQRKPGMGGEIKLSKFYTREETGDHLIEYVFYYHYQDNLTEEYADPVPVGTWTPTLDIQRSHF